MARTVRGQERSRERLQTLVARMAWVAASIGRLLLAWVLAVAALLVGARLTGYAERQFYYPDRVVYGTPTDQGLRYDDVWFESFDGVRLHGWFVYAVGPATATVIHVHGNAQNMTAHFSFVDWLPRRGFHVFAFDYRGYGASEGHPDRAGVHRDVAAALGAVRRWPHATPDRMVALGQSLGASVLLTVLAHERGHGIRAVIADSAFFSHSAIVADHLGRFGIPARWRSPLARWLISDEYSPGPVIANVAPVPVVFFHGTRDRIVPCHHSRQLYEQAREPRQLWLAEGRDHTEAILEPEWQDRIVQFFLRALDSAERSGSSMVKSSARTDR